MSGRDGPTAPIRFRRSALRSVSARDMAVRFGFGAGASALAGAVGKLAGEHAGGVFLAAPAILMASLTLIVKEDGVQEAREDVHGAMLGSCGLAAFAGVAAVTVARWPVLVSLLAAAGAWAAVAMAAFLVDRRLHRDRRSTGG